MGLGANLTRTFFSIADKSTKAKEVKKKAKVEATIKEDRFVFCLKEVYRRIEPSSCLCFSALVLFFSSTEALSSTTYLRSSMHRFFIKTPWWAKKLFPDYVWHIGTKENIVYLTFDDGPHPHVTPWVLKQLKMYNAKATFFCIGANVVKHPETFKQLIDEGHSVGNHTQHHLNGWKTKPSVYLNDVAIAAGSVHTNLFRPPYGKIKKAQAKGLNEALQTSKAKVIMWDVLSADFDLKTTPKACVKNVITNAVAGSIVVFHDSQKAERNLKAALPAVLKNLKERGYEFGKIVMEKP